MKVKCIANYYGGYEYPITIDKVYDCDFVDAFQISIKADDGKHYWIFKKCFIDLTEEFNSDLKDLLDE